MLLLFILHSYGVIFFLDDADETYEPPSGVADSGTDSDIPEGKLKKTFPIPYNLLRTLLIILAEHIGGHHRLYRLQVGQLDIDLSLKCLYWYKNKTKTV